MPLVVDKNRCPQNHRCPLISICPQQAISQTGFGLPRIDSDKYRMREMCPPLWYEGYISIGR